MRSERERTEERYKEGSSALSTAIAEVELAIFVRKREKAKFVSHCDTLYFQLPRRAREVVALYREPRHCERRD